LAHSSHREELSWAELGDLGGNGATGFKPFRSLWKIGAMALQVLQTLKFLPEDLLGKFAPARARGVSTQASGDIPGFFQNVQ
jgi:hypothetical protein